MGRKSELEAPTQICLILEKKVLEQLKLQAEKTNVPVNKILRTAIDTYLGSDNKELFKVSKEVKNISKLFSFMATRMLKDSEQTTFELKRSDMGIMFGAAWFNMKSIVEMAANVLCMKGIDAMFEEDVTQNEIAGTNRTKQERAGFTIITLSPISKTRLLELSEEIVEDCKTNGFVAPCDLIEEPEPIKE